MKKEISGVEAKYHNCIIINGKGILNKKNLNQSNQSIRHLPNKLLWEIENPLLKYKRRLLFNKNIVVIKDDFILMKKGYYKIEGNLNLDSKWQVSKNQKNFFLSKDNESLVIELIGISSSSLVKGFNYPQYGLKESIQSIRWELNVQKEDKFSVVTNIKLSS